MPDQPSAIAQPQGLKLLLDNGAQEWLRGASNDGRTPELWCAAGSHGAVKVYRRWA